MKEHSFRKSTDWKSVSLFCHATIGQGKLTISQVYSNLSTFLFRSISSLQFVEQLATVSLTDLKLETGSGKPCHRTVMTR